MSRPVHPPHHAHAHVNVTKQQYDTHDVWNFEHPWHTKLFGCKPAGRCCFSCFCACCMGCKVAKHLGETAAIGCLPCSWPYLRTKLRTARRINGSCCGDCCASVCCMSCMATQLSNELESQGMWDPPKVKKTKQPRNDRPHHYDD